jgi:Leucine-rich repeat (LRR) protein
MTECEFKNTVDVYTCIIHAQKNIDDPITLTGNHLPWKSNDDVCKLDIQRCDFLTFPQNLHELFPNLNHLKIQNCNLEHIGIEHIGKLQTMTCFSVMFCKLRRLEGNLFSGLEKLDEINFEGNQIEQIEPEIIDDLVRMSYINFLNNTNINMWYFRDVHGLCVLSNLLKEIRIKCVPVAEQKVINELQRNMQTLAASQKQTIENHEESNEQLQNMKSALEASRLNEEKLMVEINGLKLAQQNQNTLLDEHKKTIEELQKKNTNCSQPHNVSNSETKDLTIRVGHSIFRVNRALFMARCPVIADWVRNNPEDEMLTLKDVKESTFKIVHDYINTNQLPATADHLEVYLVAAKLKMKDLEKEALNLELEISMRKYAMTFRFSEQQI